MLATFVIGLREGLEASLIVGIVAAFLKQRGDTRAIGRLLVGVGLAVLLCVGIGVALTVLDQQLPQAQQEGLETVIGLFAVATVTYMIVWTTRHARGMRRELQESASRALTRGTAGALVGMTFLAVLREGVETVVFLIAAFNAAVAPAVTFAGAVLGIVVAVGLGYGIYRGGIRLNLARFFRVTGIVLVLVAAGLLATAAHTAFEAGWVIVGQQPVADLTWLVQPGSPWSSLLTGVFGMRQRPTLLEAVLWAAYLVPVLAIVLWPHRRTARPAPAFAA